MTLVRAASIAFPDRWLMLAVGLLTPVGILMARAIVLSEGPGDALAGETSRQIIFVIVGVAAMVALSRVDYQLLGRLALPAYLAALLLLLVVLATGADEYGARRWINLGFTTLQPSEFAKIGTVLALSAYGASREPDIRGIVVLLLLTMIPAGLIVIEPDLGTTIVLIAAWGAILAAWGVSGRVLGALVLLGLCLLPIAFAVGVSDYQRERLAVFVDQDRDPLGSGFQLRQVELAFGAGGLTGRGFDGGPSALEGVSTRGSDFAFAQLGEQMGLVGAGLVLLVYAVIAWRGYDVANDAPDRFGRLLAVGLTSVIVVQAAMHVAVNLRVFPTTGIPLPFISQGGSALLAMFMAAGILQSIAAHRPIKRASDAWRNLGTR